MKKICMLFLWACLVAIWSFAVTSATWWSIDSYTANMYTAPSEASNDTIGINTIWTNQDRWWSLIQVIKNAINRVLWMLSLIALVLCLRWWFQIVTAWWDDGKQKKWISVLKHAAIWLAVIWLAWFIVTIVFWLLRWVAWTGTDSAVPNSSDDVNWG